MESSSYENPKERVIRQIESIERKPERIKNKFKGYIPLLIKEEKIIPFVNKKINKIKVTSIRKKSSKAKKAA